MRLSGIWLVFHKNFIFYEPFYYFPLKWWKVKKVPHLAHWTLPMAFAIRFLLFLFVHINWIEQIVVNWFYKRKRMWEVVHCNGDQWRLCDTCSCWRRFLVCEKKSLYFFFFYFYLLTFLDRFHFHFAYNNAREPARIAKPPSLISFIESKKYRLHNDWNENCCVVELTERTNLLLSHTSNCQINLFM